MNETQESTISPMTKDVLINEMENYLMNVSEHDFDKNKLEEYINAIENAH